MTVDQRWDRAPVFISYRRSGDAAVAHHLHDALQARFGPGVSFLDVRDIADGQEFPAVLRERLEHSRVVLVVIGPDWLAASDPVSHRRRLDDPADWVFQEVRQALARADRLVVPILTGKHAMPQAEHLPPAIAGLARRQVRRLRHETWPEDFSGLADRLAAVLTPSAVAPAFENSATSAPPGSSVDLRPQPPPIQCVRTIAGISRTWRGRFVLGLAFSPDSTLLATGAADEAVRTWNPHDGQPVHSFAGHRDTVCTVAFSHRGDLLASGSKDKTARIWNPRTGAFVRELTGPGSWVHEVAFNADDTLLAMASSDWVVYLRNPQDGHPTRALVGHASGVRAVAFSSDGRFLATAGDDRTVRVWNPIDGQTLSVLSGHSGWVRGVAFSPDGNLLASIADDKTVRIWDVFSGQCLHVLTGHKNKIWAVRFRLDNAVLATCSSDKTIRLWDPHDGHLIHVLTGHRDGVDAIAFSPDCTLLASASNNTVKIWK